MLSLSNDIVASTSERAAFPAKRSVFHGKQHYFQGGHLQPGHLKLY